MNEERSFKINLSQKDAREIESIYDGLLEHFKKLSGRADTGLIRESIFKIIDEIVKILSSTNGNGLLLYTSKIFDKDYIFAHSLNVCLIAIRIGLRQEFSAESLKNLGFLALTHSREDLGFSQELSGPAEPDKDLAEIVRLADIYDATTHSPGYRQDTAPAEALTSIVGNGKFFDKSLTKILLEEISFYPKGSWVQLCNNEIGRVTKVNRELLLRPKVEVFIDSEGRSLGQPKIVDLSERIVLYILRPLTEKEVESLEQK